MFKTLITLVVFLSTFAATFAAEIIATGVTRAEVQDAVNLASDGDVVYLPPGDETWTSGVNADGKAIFIVGSGVGNTIIRNGITSGSRLLLRFSSSGDYGFGHIEFRRNGGTKDYNGIFRLSGSGYAIVWDCLFDRAIDDHMIFATGDGVIFDCDFLFNGNGRALMARNGEGGSVGYAHGAWEQGPLNGTSQYIFMEDCSVNKTDTSSYGYADGWSGCRMVVRFCDINERRWGVHGTESSAHLRGARSSEVYHNNINITSSTSLWHEIRGGRILGFNNTMTGVDMVAWKLSAYRLRDWMAPPWGLADGVKAWDVNDTSDDGTGYDAGGAASDGVFEYGTITTGGTNQVVDTSQSWATNHWVGYTLNEVHEFTSTSSTSSTLTVAGAGWTTNQFAGYEIEFNGQTTRVLSNTSDTISRYTSSWPTPNYSTGGTFRLRRGAYIQSNTSDTINTWINTNSGSRTFATGANYEIRRVVDVLDCVGLGTQNISWGDPTPEGNEGVVQARERSYFWSNYENGSLAGASSSYQNAISSNEDYFNHTLSFDGSGGMGVGTAAEMAAITPTLTGVAFWVTDEGEWNSTNGATPDGRLYVWDGDSWELEYTPYTYPHPKRALALAAYTGIPGGGGGGGGGEPALYNGRLRFNGTGAALVRAGGSGRQLKFAGVPDPAPVTPGYIVQEDFEETGLPGPATWGSDGTTPDWDDPGFGFGQSGRLDSGDIARTSFVHHPDVWAAGKFQIGAGALPAGVTSFISLRRSSGLAPGIILRISAGDAGRVGIYGNNADISNSTTFTVSEEVTYYWMLKYSVSGVCELKVSTTPAFGPVPTDTATQYSASFVDSLSLPVDRLDFRGAAVANAHFFDDVFVSPLPMENPWNE